MLEHKVHQLGPFTANSQAAFRFQSSYASGSSVR